MKYWFLYAAGLSLAFSASAGAQSFNTNSYSTRESQISVGISIPLGSHRINRTPQIDLRFDRARIDGSGRRNIDGQGSLRISRSIAHEPVWLINNRRISSTDARRGISPLGIAGIVVGAVLVVGIVAVTADPPLNDLFER